ncbi:MAG: substrate-binding domain-containing protein [Chitinophagales bacterium]|nr:substrate-binding domain-containing protein [Chitinophagales bacterium]
MRLFFFLLLGSFFFTSCKTETDKADKSAYDLDNINVGEISLFADINTESLLSQLGKIYSVHFPKASVKANYRKDVDVMNAMLSDSTRIIVLQRECTASELEQIKVLHESKPLQYTFAYNAITLIKDKESKDSIIDSLSFAQQIVKGQEKIVTIGEYSDLYSLLLRKYGVVDGNRKLKTVRTIEELQAFLKKEPDYIGILPFSLISDIYNPVAKEIVSKFRWLGVSGKNDVFISQSSIYTQEWPFVIPYTVLYCNISSHDGVGFVKFIHTKQASKLILKAGLIPYLLPDRDIKVEPQSFNIP